MQSGSGEAWHHLTVVCAVLCPRITRNPRTHALWRRIALPVSALGVWRLTCLHCERCPVCCGVFGVFPDGCPVANNPLPLGAESAPLENHSPEDDTWSCFLERNPSDDQEVHLGKAGCGCEKGERSGLTEEHPTTGQSGGAPQEVVGGSHCECQSRAAGRWRGLPLCPGLPGGGRWWAGPRTGLDWGVEEWGRFR